MYNSKYLSTKAFATGVATAPPPPPFSINATKTISGFFAGKKPAVHEWESPPGFCAEPVFAAIFGTIVLKKLKDHSLNEAYFHTFTLLNNENHFICEKLESENCNIWENRIRNYSGNFNTHTNLYAAVLYT